jgi:hypothetical protein
MKALQTSMTNQSFFDWRAPGKPEQSRIRQAFWHTRRIAEVFLGVALTAQSEAVDNPLTSYDNR